MNGNKILVLGAGAVGQVYGWHLQRGGATVGWVVRPRQVEQAHAGFVLYPLNQGRDPASIRTVLATSTVCTTADEVRTSGPWDQVWVCVSATALKNDAVRGVLEAAGPDATVVLLTPGPDDLGWLSSFIAPSRIVTGTIPFISWHAPLPGETLDPPGMMFWHPPLSSTALDGARADRAVGVLRAGGARASVRADQLDFAARGAGLLACIIAGLEASGWTFAGFRGSAWPDRCAEAAREAVGIGAAMRGLTPGPMRWIARGWVLRLLTRLAPAVMPFDLETYLRVHFTKVGAQQRQSMDHWVHWAAAHDLPHAALAALRERIGPAPT